MRITGGKARSRKLITPKATGKNGIRPTSDRVREAIFSILGELVHGARVLDLFAGTGSFVLDALCRGAGLVIIADESPQALTLFAKNLDSCFEHPPAEVIRSDLKRSSSYSTLKKRYAQDMPFDIIFLDPPYEKKLAETALTMIEKTGLVASKGIVIAEERWKAALPEEIGGLHLHLYRRYGETGIWRYKQQNRQNVLTGTTE